MDVEVIELILNRLIVSDRIRVSVLKLAIELELKKDFTGDLEKSTINTLILHNLCESEGGRDWILKFTTEGRIQYLKHKSFSAYLEYIKTNETNTVDMDSLKRRNLELQNDKLEYEKTIRNKDDMIRDLNIINGRLIKYKNYWWLASVAALLIGYFFRILQNNAY